MTTSGSDAQAALLQQQQNMGNLIMRFITNFRKTSQEKQTFFFCESWVHLLEKYWAKFEERHEELLVLPGFAATEYAKNDSFSTVEEAYVEAIAYLREAMAKSPSKISRTDSPTTTPSTSYKLIKMDLPIFSGDSLEWETFKNLFRSSVHDNQVLSNSSRFQYLKTHLAGDAALLIRNITITDENYLGAWQTLLERYDNERIIVTHHLDRILSLQPLADGSAKNLRALFLSVTESRRSLANLGRPVEHWDDWLVYLTVKKLPLQTRQDWEDQLGDRKTLPSWNEFSKFMAGRIVSREVTASLSNSSKPTRTTNSNDLRKNLRSHAVKMTRGDCQKLCALCGELHYIGYCKLFKQKTPQQRREEAVRLHLCLNCLRHHPVTECSSPHRCSICEQPHHTLLHPSGASPPAVHSHAAMHTSSFTLLATALVQVHGPNGRSAVVRTLLDQGSEASFISENLAQYLRVPRTKVTVPVFGMGASRCGVAKAKAHIHLSAASEGYKPSLAATVFILPHLLKTFQPRQVDTRRWSHLQHLNFADSASPQFQNIELVIGADLYGYALMEGLVKGPPGTPVAQQTIFGWVLSGTVSDGQDASPPVHTLHCSVDVSLADDLRRFWEIEEIPTKRLFTPEEEFCEEHFRTTHSRDPDGRFVVRLPRRPGVPLGDSYPLAYRAFHRNERQRQKNPELQLAYSTFMEEYARLGHMKTILEAASPAETFYLPHHAVWKTEGDTSKIRVVFNASACSFSGHSLNDALLPGPKLQQELTHILLRWRRYPIVFSSDIVKMFRQIWVDHRDQPLQRILWRNHPGEELQVLQLQTVTYGTACAPYLAIRCLLQLASEGAVRFPKAAETIQNQTYVDDILAGADTLEEEFSRKGQLEQLLRAGGFELAKWSSNVEALAPNSHCQHILPDGSVKTLGILWNPKQDFFGFRVQLENSLPINKRNILSCISRLFDPLGWLSPVLVTAKIFLQDLWIVSVDWDATLPEDLENSWREYYLSLQELQAIQIPRWIDLRTHSRCEIHGFSDASPRAYAAAVYLRTEDSPGVFKTHLLASKTKVAPLRVLSLPRLELAGAVLLVRLLKNICDALQFSSPPVIHAWSDSQVVLHWINAIPARWKCFVANRVSEIHQTLPNAIWHHVRSTDNPADAATRGIPAAALQTNLLWWCGPPWLSEPSDSWPTSATMSIPPDALQEENPKVQTFAVTLDEPWTLLERYSSLTRLIRVTSWIFRFADNARSAKENRHLAPLSVSELTRSRHFWIKSVQEQQFAEEIRLLQGRQDIPKRSTLYQLRPFIDSNNILRVGGRLENASLTYNEKHPIILSARSYFTKLLVSDCHRRTLHGGPQLTLNQLSSHYWILGGRNLVRKIIKTCNVCFRYAKTPAVQPLMGQLPASRVTPSRPFLHCGLDYAGPLILRHTKGRGRGTTKGYIAVFVCMATKAVHLEVVSDCSTAAFLAAFKRFVARRGIPSALYSDQSTTFRGADAELKTLFTQASAENAEISDLLANDGTQWHFIPPHSPHFGGLWEAGVKSVKGHLRKVLGDTRLTFEEVSTLLAEIESCLNSRPISPISTSPRDLTPLTPGHFLIGAPTRTLPEPSLTFTPLNRLSRWQLLRRLYEHFWQRWSKEYLHRLQQRQKWATTTPNLQPDDLVLLPEDNLPPSKWRLGRVIQVHPGADGVVRVATVRTSNSIYQRPAVKLLRLPLQ